MAILENEAPAEATGDPEVLSAQELFDEGDFAAAETLLTELLSRDIRSARIPLLLSRARARLGKLDEALAAAEAGCASYPKNRALKTQYGRLLLKRDRPDDAERVFAQASTDFPDDARMHALRADASLANGAPDRALAAIELAIAAEPGIAEFGVRKAAALCALGRVSEAKRLIQPDQIADLWPIMQTMIDRVGELGRATDAASIAANTCRLIPESADAWTGCAKAMLTAKRTKEALAAIESLSRLPLTAEAAIDAERLRVRALRQMSDDVGAAAVLERILATHPEDEFALRELYLAHQRLGRDKEMRDAGRKLSSAGARKLPPTLKAGLEAVRAQEPPRAPPNEKMQWAWEIAGRPQSEFEAWRAAVHWGEQADKLLRAWWLNAPERAGEIDDLLEWPSPSPIDELPRKGRCVAVTTHLGPMAGQVRYFQTCGRPFRGFGRAGPDPVVGSGPPMRIASRGNHATALKEMIRALELGTMIGFASDIPESEGTLTFDFLGRSVALSTFVPRLVLKHEAATVWCQALWRNGRMVIEAERLPDPAPGETAEDWSRRWCEAYLAKIERVMRGAPENLNLASGIWQNVNPEFARKREARRSAGAEAA